MFGWAISEGLGSRDPTAGIRRRDKTSPRERMLNQNEIATFWNRLHEIYPDERRQLVAKLLLLTGQRKGEVLFAERSELHLEGAEPVWVLPGRRTKNKRVHVVPLSRAAVSLWRRAVQISSHDELLFHADGTMQKLAPDMMTKPLARAFCNHKAKIRQLSGRYATVRRPRLLSCEPFVPHDLRRTVASHMARLGIDRTVIGKCLNHVTADRLTITGMVYDRHDYADEKRAALTRWAAELDRLINAQAPLFLASATA
jgi:integrase